MWNVNGWGPMPGMWFMPFFCLFFMAIVIIVGIRIFKGQGGCCGSSPLNSPAGNDSYAELLKEVRSLRCEVAELRDKTKKSAAYDGQDA
jgi:hypothetical protein